MRKLLASLGVATLVAVGLFVASPLKGSVVHPQTANACYEALAGQSPTEYDNVFDYNTYSTIYIGFRIDLWIDTCQSGYYVESYVWNTTNSDHFTQAYGIAGVTNGTQPFGTMETGYSCYDNSICGFGGGGMGRIAWSKNLRGFIMIGGQNEWAQNSYWSPPTSYSHPMCWSFSYSRYDTGCT